MEIWRKSVEGTVLDSERIMRLVVEKGVLDKMKRVREKLSWIVVIGTTLYYDSLLLSWIRDQPHFICPFLSFFFFSSLFEKL